MERRKRNRFQSLTEACELCALSSLKFDHRGPHSWLEHASEELQEPSHQIMLSITTRRRLSMPRQVLSTCLPAE